MSEDNKYLTAQTQIEITSQLHHNSSWAGYNCAGICHHLFEFLLSYCRTKHRMLNWLSHSTAIENKDTHWRWLHKIHCSNSLLTAENHISATKTRHTYLFTTQFPWTSIATCCMQRRTAVESVPEPSRLIRFANGITFTERQKRH